MSEPLIRSTGRTTEHPQVIIEDPDGAPVEVDELLAVPLSVMWRAGIRTTFSCQGDLSATPTWGAGGYCVLSDRTRTYEAMTIIGRALDVCTFRLDSLSGRDLRSPLEVLRWFRTREPKPVEREALRPDRD